MADQNDTGPTRLPTRQSRARDQLGAVPNAAPSAAPRPAPRRPAPPRQPARSCVPPSTPTGPPSTPTGPPLDLDRLRASTASAISVERSHGGGSTPNRTDSASGDGRGTPLWLKVALPIGVVAALATAGLTMAGGDDTTPTATRDREASAARVPSTTTVATTNAPPTDAPTSAAPTTATPETSAPTTVPVATSPSPDAPHHKATYRDGKLYLEGSITSQEEAQKYIDKAAAVLGADNVVNNYVIDPSIPLSTDGTVYVDEPFLFETGSSDLNPEYTGILGLGVAALRLNPNARMAVTGYTDSKGDPARNQELSLERANAVVEYMVTTGGIDRSRFDAVGAGDRNPVGDNNTEEGRKQNRRIDVKLVNLLG